jgi:hypothetical protein
MEPRKDDLEQTPQPRPEEKKRRFRLVKLEERRFRMDRLEDRIAPTLVGSATNSGSIGTLYTCHHHGHYCR